jgi:predicted enzyme related to lactoylglutathione lyase
MAKKKQMLQATMVYYYVSDMEKAIKFYSDVLGLKLKVRFQNHWAELDAGPITIGLHPTEKGKKPKSGGGTISCNVADIETFVEEIKSKGAKVSKIFAPERGKFVMVSDPDGNEIHVVEFNPDWVKKTGYKK